MLEKFLYKKQKAQENKTFFTITLILLLALATFVIAVPSTEAQTYTWVSNTWAYISVTPNPAAVNQPVIVLMFLDVCPPDAQGPQGSRWQGYKCNIVDPTGKNITKGPFSSDDVAGAWFMYTPTMVGNYTFQWSWPGQDITMSGTVRHYYGAMSRPLNVLVQQNIEPGFQNAPIPSGYWTRPINGQNRDWAATVAGNWLTNAYNSSSRSFDAGTAIAPNAPPLSAHILWTKPEILGGIVGPGYGASSYYTGYSYEAMFKPPIIISGNLYYNTFQAPRYGFKCVNLATGEEKWFKNESINGVPATLSFGQILDYESPNQHGATAYLWATGNIGFGQSAQTYWNMFDANTGNYILTINMTGISGTQVFGPNGEILRYSIAYDTTLKTQTVKIWNSTKAIPPGSATGSSYWQWRPDALRGQILNGTVNKYGESCFETPIPIQNITGQSITTFTPDDTVIVSSGLIRIGYNFHGWNLKWMANFSRRTDYPINYSVSGTVYGNDGLAAEYLKQTMQWYGYDLKTGQPTWGPTEPYKSDMGLYNFQMSKFYYNGFIINAGYDGIVHAINMATGETAWEFYAGQATDWDLPYGTWPFYSGQVATGGYIFAMNGEHSPSDPIPRGEKMFAIDAETGVNVWNISGLMEQPVVADQKLVSLNGYDNQIYCFGKGPSATTVSAPQTGIPLGTPIMITGTVTDQTPQLKGTPAIADDYMGKWMEYLVMQQSIPGDAKGVNVRLTAIDPAGKSIDIGTVQSDMSGLFKKSWIPTLAGEYTIIATFEGTNSYGGSYAETAIVAYTSPATSPVATSTPTPITPPTSMPPPSTSPSQPPQPPTENPNTTLYVSIAAVVIIASIAAVALMLRRRK